MGTAPVGPISAYLPTLVLSARGAHTSHSSRRRAHEEKFHFYYLFVSLRVPPPYTFLLAGIGCEFRARSGTSPRLSAPSRALFQVWNRGGAMLANR